MIVISRKVDEWVQVGTDVFVGPTDIDDRIVRVLVRGRMIGGPSDGLPFEAAHEMSRGQSFPIGPMVVVTCVDIRPQQVRLGFDAPHHLPVRTKEHADALRRKRDEEA